ncbi:TetR/AcrR family transcriptional regulator [Streptomyces marispadix]|nr:TetR family transcriptional regulator [Streptomyces marispadix]
MAPAARTESSAVPASRPGLRERKKIKTRQAIRKAAYRLFDEQGYSATSVERIAEEAEVSPSTVFRYFPTKEDIVLSDEYDPLLHDALLARPADEPPVTALRRAMLDVLAQAMAQEPGREPAEAHQRMRLVQEVPALRARMTEHMSVTGRLLAGALADRTGLAADSFELRVLTGALLGALAEAMFCWSESDDEPDVIATVDRAMRLVEGGLDSAVGGSTSQ